MQSQQFRLNTSFSAMYITISTIEEHGRFLRVYLSEIGRQTDGFSFAIDV